LQIAITGTTADNPVIILAMTFRAEPKTVIKTS